MKRFVAPLLALAISASAMPCQADTVDDLRLYMGDKIWFKESETWGGAVTEIPNGQAGLTALGRTGYIYTSADAGELVAEAVSHNINSLVLSSERQLEARELLKLLNTIDSGIATLTKQGYGDILPSVLAGEYKATSTVAAEDEEAALAAAVPDYSIIVEDCDIGGIGESLVWAVRGDSWVTEPFGYEGAHSLLLGVGKDSPVLNTFSGVAIAVGGGVIEIESLDKRLRLKYEGVAPSCVQGVYYPQGAEIGATAGNALRISLTLDEEPKNVLEAWGARGKQIARLWRGGHPNVALALGEFDSEYHEVDAEKGRINKDSYFNPDEFVRRGE